MTTNDRLDPTLAWWFESEARTDGAATLLEATLAQTGRRSPRPARLAALRQGSLGPLMRPASPTTRRLAYAALLAGAIATALIGSVFLAGQHDARPAPSLLCVGEPPDLCAQPAGAWTSAALLPGLAMAFPSEGWWTRDRVDRIELKTAPMASAVLLQLDPVPFPQPWQPQPDRSGTIASLTAWLRLHPGLIATDVGERRTPGGLAIATFDLEAAGAEQPGGLCAKLFVPRASPQESNATLVCHYAQRMHLLDLGDGHRLSILIVAYDSSPGTVRALDEKFGPILDSIRPPPSIEP
jgi:hypothetical protein